MELVKILLAAIMLIESGGDPLAVGFRGPAPVVRAVRTDIERIGAPVKCSKHGNEKVLCSAHPRSAEDAVRIVRLLLKRNVPFDVGLLQISSSNLKRRRVAPELLLAPEVNVPAGLLFLLDCLKRSGDVRGALSCYNCGTPDCAAGRAYAERVLSLTESMGRARLLRLGSALLSLIAPERGSNGAFNTGKKGEI